MLISRPAFLSEHARGCHALFQNIHLAGSLVLNLAHEGRTVRILWREAGKEGRKTGRKGEWTLSPESWWE